MKTKKTISILCLLFFGFLLLLPSMSLLIMSFKDYKPISGLFGSASVGLTNITMFWEQPAIIRVLKNTFNISILALVIAAIYLFVAILAINSFQKGFMKALAAVIFVLPAILPPNTYILMLQTWLPTEFLTKSSVLLQVIASAENGLRFASVFVIAALFTKGDSMPHAQKYVLLYISMKFIHILATDTGFMNAFYNPLTYEHLDTYDSYLYRSGLMQAKFSGYAAGYVVRLILQLLPALIGLFILASLCKSEQKKINVASTAADQSSQNTMYTSNDSGNRIYFPCMILALLPLALAYLIWNASSDGSLDFSQPLVQQGYVNGFLTAGASAAVVVCFGLLLATAAVQLNRFGITLLALLYFLSDNLLGPYMIGRQLGTHDTLMGVLIQNMPFILPVAIIGTKILREKHQKNLLPALTISSLGLAFAWFWGDHMAPLVTLRSAHKYPISLLMHSMLNRQGAIDASSADAQLSMIPYILVPVIITGVCFIISSVLYNRKQK